MLDATPASVNSALQRARATMDERLPERSQQQTMRALGDERVRAIVQQLNDAFEEGDLDVDAILDLLTQDAHLCDAPVRRMAARAGRGRRVVAHARRALPSPPLPADARRRATGAGHLPAGRRRRLLPIALDVLALRDGRISEVIALRTPEIFLRFGLPRRISGRGRP